MQTSSAALTDMRNPFFDPIVYKSMSTNGQYAYEQIPFLKGTQVACFDGAIMTNERFISSLAREWQFVYVKPSTQAHLSRRNTWTPLNPTYAKLGGGDELFGKAARSWLMSPHSLWGALRAMGLKSWEICEKTSCYLNGSRQLPLPPPAFHLPELLTSIAHPVCLHTKHHEK